MAIRLLVALIALGLLHWQPRLAHWRNDAGFRRWVAQLGDTSGTGRVVARVTSTYLCRCGGSANKPFCDGTHTKIGFRSDA